MVCYVNAKLHNSNAASNQLSFFNGGSMSHLTTDLTSVQNQRSQTDVEMGAFSSILV